MPLTVMFSLFLWSTSDFDFDQHLIQRAYPGLVIEGVREAAVPPFLELSLSDGQVVYLSHDGRYLLVGAMMDLATQTNLTEQRNEEARQHLLAELPRDLFEFPAPQSRAWVTVITDIDCAYCRRLHQQMAEYHAQGISLRYLMMPRAGNQGSAYDKAVAAACAPDPAAALTQAMNGVDLEGSQCNHSIAEQITLARRLRPTGTPTMLTPQGRIFHGYVAPEQMARELALLGD